MTTKIQDWLDARATFERARKKVKDLEAIAYDEQPICALRPAMSSDIFQGNIIWYENEDGFYWRYVEEVRDPNSDYKAYCCHRGDRYGLIGAYVEDVK
jgi:hypothetical protein